MIATENHKLAAIRQHVGAGNNETTTRLECDGLAVMKTSDYRNIAVILSAASNSHSIKGVRAWLNSNARGYIEPIGMAPTISSSTRVGKADCGYDVRMTHLGSGTWHLAAVAKDPRLLVGLSTETLWQLIRKTDVTTPLLESWMPWLLGRMVTTESESGRWSMIERLKCFQVDAAMLNATTDDIDRLVSEGLRNGELLIK